MASLYSNKVVVVVVVVVVALVVLSSSKSESLSSDVATYDTTTDKIEIFGKNFQLKNSYEVEGLRKHEVKKMIIKCTGTSAHLFFITNLYHGVSHVYITNSSIIYDTKNFPEEYLYMVDFEVNIKEDLAYVRAIDESVRQISLLTGHWEILFASDKENVVLALALDYLTDELYYSTCSQKSKFYLYKFDLKKRAATLVKETKACLDLLAIDPHAKEIFVANETTLYKEDLQTGSTTRLVELLNIDSIVVTKQQVVLASIDEKKIYLLDRATNHIEFVQELTIDSFIVASITDGDTMSPIESERTTTTVTTPATFVNDAPTKSTKTGTGSISIGNPQMFILALIVILLLLL